MTTVEVDIDPNNVSGTGASTGEQRLPDDQNSSHHTSQYYRDNYSSLSGLRGRNSNYALMSRNASVPTINNNIIDSVYPQVNYQAQQLNTRQQI